MSRHVDSITALATPAGSAAIALIRASGPDTAVIAADLGGACSLPRMARHVDYYTRAGELLDDVLMTFFKGPNSYSGEDSLEISCHGNPFIAQRILEDLISRGCRLADRGEFTQRAFLNGKMDLSQAEAVMDLIHARSERALAAANRQLRGGLSQRLNPVIEKLLGTLARIEAYIDFPDEDLPAEDRHMVINEVNCMLLIINDLMATSHYSRLLRLGLQTVIIGMPNAGKSSLLNRLVGRERALVNPEPGTTRDFIEEQIVVGAHSIRLIDTAGLNPSPTPLEELGMEKTMERAEEADLFLLVVDASTWAAGDAVNEGLRQTLSASRTVVVFNKMDLVSDSPPGDYFIGADHVFISAFTGTGLDQLRTAISVTADSHNPNLDDLVTVNARHAGALFEARELGAAAQSKLIDNGPVELIASDLRGILTALGAISGRIDNERMLDQLFATFCIGK